MGYPSDMEIVDDWASEFERNAKIARWCVGVYSMGRNYGGPEEGGWWYDTGQLELVIGANLTVGRAAYIAERFNHLYRLVRKLGHKRDRYSMAYRGGDMQAMTYFQYPASEFPTVRPHYE